MKSPSERKLKIGGDPRALPDYAALRDELLKLSHPARPDVEWRTVETLCLRLFEHNGVDLQTAAWYTLARGHLAGLAGIQEGLALVNALTAYQWSVMWPAGVHTRMEIISGLNQRLQNVLRTLALDDRDELERLYQLEKSLKRLTETLARHELQQVSRTEGVQQRIRQAITRLENMPDAEAPPAPVTLPALALAVASAGPPERPPAVASQKPQAADAPPRATRSILGGFIAGACSALLLGGALLWGWSRMAQPSAAEQLQLQSDERQETQLGVLRPLPPQAEGASEQLQWLTALPPDWPLQHAWRLIGQARAQRPDDPALAQLQQAWRRQLDMNALSPAALSAWHDGMTKLQRLTDRLNALDEKRGKYLTVSELKSEVFAIMQTFNRAPPVAELLRRYSADAPEMQRKQAEMALAQLQKRYFLLRAGEEEARMGTAGADGGQRGAPPSAAVQPSGPP